MANPNPFSSGNSSATSSTEGVHQNTLQDSDFVAPPLPPRPRPTAHRKPVPSVHDDLDVPSNRTSLPRAIAPSLPPRPDAPTYIDENIVDRSQLPPPPGEYSEKQRPRRAGRWWYPASRRGRRWFWGLLVALVVAIAIVIAVCATVIPKKKSSSSSSSSSPSSPTTSSTSNSTSNTALTGNGGHPLSAKEGGVTIGKPGDIASFGAKSTDHFVMTTNRSIVVTRLDPIVNPNAVGSHLHRVHGASRFTANLTSATEAQELVNCTTTVVQDDKSAYWVAQLYYQWPNGSLSMIPIDRTSLYYFQKAPTGVEIYPFPDNYNIVAGDPMRRAINYTDQNVESLWWQCYRGDGNDLRTYGFPKSQCSGGLVSAIQFPSCWDGVYATDGNYTAHVSYPADNTNGYKCPDAFPKKFITIQFETVFAVADFPYNGNNNVTWVLSNGDTSGYGIHADFMNGWKTETLQTVLDDCRYMNATTQATASDDPANCPALNKTIDFAVTYSCQLQTQIVDEDVGELNPIQYLPGCNGIWSGNTSKPACPGDHVDGGYLELVQPSVWYQNEPYIS